MKKEKLHIDKRASRRQGILWYLLTVLIALIALKMAQQFVESGRAQAFSKLGDGIINRLDDISYAILIVAFLSYCAIRGGLGLISDSWQKLPHNVSSWKGSKAAKDAHVVRLTLASIFVTVYVFAMWSTKGAWWAMSAILSPEHGWRYRTFQGLQWTEGFLIAGFIANYYICWEYIAEAEHHVIALATSPQVDTDVARGGSLIANAAIIYMLVGAILYVLIWWPYKCLVFNLSKAEGFQRLMNDGGGAGAVVFAVIVYWIPILIRGIVFLRRINPFWITTVSLSPLKFYIPIPHLELSSKSKRP